MKWFQKASGSKSFSQSSAISAASDGSGESVDPVDESEHTERSAVPDQIEGDVTPAPGADRSGRSISGRRLTRTVASPIPAMLAESMGLAEEPPTPTSPVDFFKATSSNRR